MQWVKIMELCPALRHGAVPRAKISPVYYDRQLQNSRNFHHNNSPSWHHPVFSSHLITWFISARHVRLHVTVVLPLLSPEVQQLSLPEPPQIKEEQELWTSQEEEQLQGLQSETTDSMFTRDSNLHIRAFLSERLTTAASEIFGEIGRASCRERV